MSRSASRLLCLLLAVLLCSCSRIQLAYHFFPWYLSSRAHHYLKLDDAQEKVLKQDLRDYAAWHRATMLPAYAAACRRLALGLRGKEEPSQNIAQVTPLLTTLYCDTMQPLVAPSAALLASLEAPQIDYLEAALKDELKEQRKDFLEDPAAAQQRRLEKSVVYVEDYAGALDEGQKRQVEALTLAVHVPSQAWIEDRQRRAEDLLRLLRSSEPQAQKQVEAQAILGKWWLRGRMAQDSSDKTRMDPEALKAYFLGVFKLLRPEQRQKAAARMEALAQGMESLAPSK
jgi:hypothetical protein